MNGTRNFYAATMNEDMKSSEYHPITNFKKDTSLLKRIGANILFFIGTTKITLRNNLLTPLEYKAVKKLIEPGDIVLVGDHRHMSAMLIQGAVTHALLFVGKGKLIHAVGDGVKISRLRKLFKEYDTLMVVRPKLAPYRKEKIITDAIVWARAQLGKPYDYEFDTDTEKFFCTQLVNEAYYHAGLHLGFTDHEPSENIILEQLRRWKNVIRPKDMARGHVAIVFLSRYLKNQSDSIILSEPLWIKNAQDTVSRIITK